VREQQECTELRVGMGNPTERLCVRIKGQTNMCDVALGVCCRLPDQGKHVDEAFYRQLEVASHSQALVLVRDFYHTNTC